MDKLKWLEQRQKETCKKKKTFIDKRGAKGYANLKKVSGLKLKPYRCPVCSLYHLTTRGVKK